MNTQIGSTKSEVAEAPGRILMEKLDQRISNVSKEVEQLEDRLQFILSSPQPETDQSLDAAEKDPERSEMEIQISERVTTLQSIEKRIQYILDRIRI